ncbi:MAG: branched-chain amino acid ABC transporter permease [Methanocellales archaeon]
MRLRFYLGLAGLALALLIPLASGSLYVLTVLILLLIFIIYASAWNLLTYSGQGSLGHAAFFGIGGYASSLIALKMGLPPIITIFIGGFFSAFIGILIGLTCIRLKEWFLAMVTFGFAIIAQTITVSQLAPITGGWDGISSPRLLSSEIPFYNIYEYYIILALAILIILFIQMILKSKIGLALAAIRENELEARAAGIDTAKYKLLAFTISTFLAGLAGALEAHHFGYITPEIFGIELSFWPIIYSISGGLGTIEGPIIGTIAVTALWDGLRFLGLTYERFIIIGLMLILIVIFLPRGLISLLEKIERLFQIPR